MLFQGPAKWPKWQTWTARVTNRLNRHIYIIYVCSFRKLVVNLGTFAALTLWTFDNGFLNRRRAVSSRTQLCIFTPCINLHLMYDNHVQVSSVVSSSIIFWYSHLQKPIPRSDLHSLPLSLSLTRRPPRVVFIVTMMQMVTPNLYPNTSTQVTHHGISLHLTMTYEQDDTRWNESQRSNVGNVNALPVEAS